MENKSFISLDGNKVLSHVKIYESDFNHKIHLIPVIHIGTADYFLNIVEYVGEIPCIFENLKLGRKNSEFDKPIKNIDDFIESYSKISEKKWREYDSLIKKFIRKYISKDIKKLHKTIRNLVNELNGKLKTIYELCEKTNFDLSNLLMIQLYWCEILKLKHQFVVIDYVNDIPNRRNWIHTDLNFEKLMDQENLKEIINQFFKDPTQQQVIEAQKQMKLVLLSIFQSLQFIKTDDISQRRREFARIIIDEVAIQYKAFENLSPKLLFNVRNEMIANVVLDLLENEEEIMIFYGATHMIFIEKMLLDAGFKPKTEKLFEIFNTRC
ncbi:MAG: hypothetical protein ACFE9Z_01510 [Promethearchaeota archaeon]